MHPFALAGGRGQGGEEGGVGGGAGDGAHGRGVLAHGVHAELAAVGLRGAHQLDLNVVPLQQAGKRELGLVIARH